MGKSGKRGVSAGTVVMLILTALVLAGSFLILSRLSSGRQADLSRLWREPESTAEAMPEQETDGNGADEPEETLQPAAAPAAKAETEPAPAEAKSFTLTVGGSVCLSGELRQNSYYSDVKQYDFYDDLILLKSELQSDLSILFLENILSDSEKASDVVAARAGAAMLKAAGINAAACGYAHAWDKGAEGIASTRRLLNEQQILPLGIQEQETAETSRIREVNGIRTALLQYTGTMTAATRKNMTKKGESGLVPPADAETITADIEAAREQGCDAVIVLLNWGKTGKAPEKAQRTLAQQIADAGADLIIGNGSRIVSGAETLTDANGREVLCVWSLGTLLSGDRSSIRRMTGMLLHASVRKENGKTEIRELAYTPVYTWKYKMDGRFYYRSLPAGGRIPDGMDNDQQKQMAKSAELVREAMKNAPAEEKGVE